MTCGFGCFLLAAIPAVAANGENTVFENVQSDLAGAFVDGKWIPWSDEVYHSGPRQSCEHSRNGMSSVYVTNGDPYIYSSYADFGAPDESVGAEVYEDMKVGGKDATKPVTCMLALFGDASVPSILTDYLAPGVVDHSPGDSQSCFIPSRYTETRAPSHQHRRGK